MNFKAGTIIKFSDGCIDLGFTSKKLIILKVTGNDAFLSAPIHAKKGGTKKTVILDSPLMLESKIVGTIKNKKLLKLFYGK